VHSEDVTIPNHALLMALDWKHRYGSSSLELVLARIDVHLKAGEVVDAREWTQVATVLTRALLRTDASVVGIAEARRAQPTPL
jgi:hypothetical protein